MCRLGVRYVVIVRKIWGNNVCRRFLCYLRGKCEIREVSY